jgi:tyrosinase
VADNRLRYGLHNLPAAQIASLRAAHAAQMAITDNRGYQFLAGLHGVPGNWCWHHQGNAKSARHMQLFLPWHRAYLYHFEMGLRDRVPGVTLGWWDWTLRPPRQRGLPAAYAAARVGGRPNPLASFRINLPQSNPPVIGSTRRQPGAPGDLPTQPDVNNALDKGDWLDFTMALEQLHDAVHGWTGGHMGLVPVAAFDPVFWAHHCMIDRIWWLWQVRNGNANIPADLLDVPLAPFNMKVRDVLNVNDLGYDYAAGGAAIATGGVR